MRQRRWGVAGPARRRASGGTCDPEGPSPRARGGQGPRLTLPAVAGSAECGAGQFLSGCGGTSPGACAACLSCAAGCGGGSAGVCPPGAVKEGGNSSDKDSGEGSSDNSDGAVYVAVLAVIPIGLVIFFTCYVRRIAERDRKAGILREEMLRGQGLACVQLVNHTGGAVQVAKAGCRSSPGRLATHSRSANDSRWARAMTTGAGCGVTGVLAAGGPGQRQLGPSRGLPAAGGCVGSGESRRPHVRVRVAIH